MEVKVLSPLMFNDELKALRKCSERAVRSWAKQVRKDFGLIERSILPDEIVAKAMGISMERLLLWRMEFEESRKMGNKLHVILGLPFLELLFGKMGEV
jgi:hypothetical protein